VIKIIFAVLFMLTCCSVSRAKDNGQWENTDPIVKKWYQNLMQPPPWTASSCCGEADAYWCDDYYARDKKSYCKITDDRDDKPLGRPHLDVGTEIEIPDSRLKFDQGNPTGHAIVFLGGAGSYIPGRPVFCYVQNSGS